MNVYLDCESFSTADLSGGVFVYAEAGAYPIIICYAVDDGPVITREITDSGWYPQDLAEIQSLIDEAEYIVIHNAQFDRTVLANVGIKIPLQKTHCTMAQAACHGLPGALGTLCEIFKLPQDLQKQSTGRALIRRFCMPQKDGTKCDRTTHPEQWAQFVDYAGHDVLAMRALYAKLPRGNLAIERRIWIADQMINERGFAADRALCENFVLFTEGEKRATRGRTRLATHGEVESPTQTAKLLEYILDAYGISLPDLRESTIERRLSDEQLPLQLRELLADRLTSAKASSAKYAAAIKGIQKDGRIRGTLQYCGARRTGRWSGRLLQPQNFARPTQSPDNIEGVCRQVAAGHAPPPQLSIAQWAKECVRGIIVAPQGEKLGVVDLAQIEARITPWLAGDQAAMDAFALFDKGLGPDNYKLAFANTFGKSVEHVTKQERALGKVLVLSLGFGGGVAALLTGCAAYKFDPQIAAQQAMRLADADMRRRAAFAFGFAKGSAAKLDEHTFVGLWCITRLWRQANYKIPALWADLESAFGAAVRTRKPVNVGRLVVDSPVAAWARVKLPSGRYLMYASPQLDGEGKITYAGISPYTRKWGRCSTWGGTLAENAVQATARDIVAHAIADMEAEAIRVVLSVHDEVVVELNDCSVDEIVQIMTRGYPWTKGLPLAAEGFDCQRYRK